VLYQLPLILYCSEMTKQSDRWNVTLQVLYQLPFNSFWCCDPLYISLNSTSSSQFVRFEPWRAQKLPEARRNLWMLDSCSLKTLLLLIVRRSFGDDAQMSVPTPYGCKRRNGSDRIGQTEKSCTRLGVIGWSQNSKPILQPERAWEG